MSTGVSSLSVRERATDTCLNFTSDGGNKSLRVSRPGFVRIALRAPQNRAGKFPETVNIRCYAVAENSASESACRNVRLIKLVRLDRNYLPVVKNIDAVSQNVTSGEKATFLVPSGF